MLHSGYRNLSGTLHTLLEDEALPGRMFIEHPHTRERNWSERSLNYEPRMLEAKHLARAAGLASSPPRPWTAPCTREVANCGAPRKAALKGPTHNTSPRYRHDVRSPRRSSVQRELVCRHLQGIRQAEAELQGKGAPAAPKLGLTPPYSEGPAHISEKGGGRDVNTGQLSSAEGEKRGHSNAAQLPETNGLVTNAGQPEGRQASTCNRAGLTIESSSPRTQSLRLKVGCEIGGEIGPIPANVRGALTLPTDPDGSRSTDLEDSWKGEILPGFLFLGDRMTASDMDRLTTLEVHPPLQNLPRGALLAVDLPP